LGFSNVSDFPIIVDKERLLSHKYDESLEEKYSGASTNFLFVGRIAPNKRHEEIIRIFHRYCCQNNPNSRLFLVGSETQAPAYAHRLKILTAKLGIEQKVIFTGHVTDAELHSYYRIADVFLCMSDHEGFGVPIIESFIFGVPVFAFKSSAVPEIMGDAGVLLGEASYEETAELIHIVLQNREIRERIIEKQRQWAEEFSRANARRRLMKLLKKIQHLDDGKELFFSVAVVTYNRGSVLENCLDSLRNLDYDNYEVVVVNGPSTDNTEEVLKKYPDIKIRNNPHINISISRNLAIAASSGEVVAFIDDDAFPASSWLRDLNEFYAVNPNVGGVGGIVFQHPSGQVQFKNGLISIYGEAVTDREEAGLCNEPGGIWYNIMMGVNSSFRKSALLEVGGFDEHYEYMHDETDLAIRVINSGHPVVHHPSAPVFHIFSDSHIRRSAYDINWYVIVKNTIYMSLKNMPSSVPLLKKFGGVLKTIIRQRLRNFNWARKNGQITFPEYMRYNFRVSRGISRGYLDAVFARKKNILAETESIDTFLKFKSEYESGPPEEKEKFPLISIKGDLNGEREKLRVCLLSQDYPPDGRGGVATSIHNLARGLERLGHEVHVICRGDSNGHEVRDGVNLHFASSKKADSFPLLDDYPICRKNIEYGFAVFSKLNEIIKGRDIDIIESPTWDFEGLVCSENLDIPLVVRVYTPMKTALEIKGEVGGKDHKLAAELEKRLVEKADGVLTHTQDIKNLAMATYETDFSNKPVGQFPLATDFSDQVDFEPYRPDSDVLEILFVGRLEKRKGIHTLLEVIPEILGSLEKARFSLVGEDCFEPGRSLEEEFFEEHPQYRERVSFLGAVSDEDLQNHYRTCDLFVAPSLYESFGLIYLEAMVWEKPVIGCRIGGIPEVVNDEVTGILVPPEDSRSLADAILKLANDPGLRSAMGKAGRAWVEERFSIETFAENTVSFYRSIIEKKQEERHPEQTNETSGEKNNLTDTRHLQYPGTTL
jgi:hypothetical protein